MWPWPRTSSRLNMASTLASSMRNGYSPSARLPAFTLSSTWIRNSRGLSATRSDCPRAPGPQPGREGRAPSLPPLPPALLPAGPGLCAPGRWKSSSAPRRCSSSGSRCRRRYSRLCSSPAAIPRCRGGVRRHRAPRDPREEGEQRNPQRTGTRGAGAPSSGSCRGTLR